MNTVKTDSKRRHPVHRAVVALIIVVSVLLPAVARTDDMQTMVQANTGFAFDMYKKLAEDKTGNLFFSPFSISMALAMTYAGARGETEKQMARALHFQLPQKQLHPAFSQLMARLDAGKGYQLSLANALWGQKGFKFLDDFLKVTGTDYRGGLKEVNFKGDPNGSRKIINSWVEDKTQKKITELLTEPDIKSNTRLVLTNAIYFKGTWVTQFDPKTTREAPFYLDAGKTIAVPMMMQKGKYNYMDNDTLQMVELPYSGDDLSMIVILPWKKDQLTKIEQMLTAENFQKWRSELRKEEVRIALPKFKTTARFVLNAPLAELGMEVPFSDAADFSGMTGLPDLVISAVIHKAFVDVNEEGTEAAAATAVVMVTKSAMREENVFRADHPFIFSIVDKRTGSVLFLGRLINPAQV